MAGSSALQSARDAVTEVPTTAYFREKVLRDRRYVTLDQCLAVLAEPLRRHQQADGRWRMWGRVTLPEPLGTRILRVVTLADGTLHNAFVDRGFQEEAI